VITSWEHKVSKKHNTTELLVESSSNFDSKILSSSIPSFPFDAPFLLLTDVRNQNQIPFFAKNFNVNPTVSSIFGFNPKMPSIQQLSLRV